MANVWGAEPPLLREPSGPVSPITNFPRGRAPWDGDSDPHADLDQEREPTDSSRLSWASPVPSPLLKLCEDGDLSDRCAGQGNTARPESPWAQQERSERM